MILDRNLPYVILFWIVEWWILKLPSFIKNLKKANHYCKHYSNAAQTNNIQYVCMHKDVTKGMIIVCLFGEWMNVY